MSCNFKIKKNIYYCYSRGSTPILSSHSVSHLESLNSIVVKIHYLRRGYGPI